MELRLLFLCSLLLQIHWANARARRQETTSDYWKEAFPNVELPKSLQNVLKPTEGESVYPSIAKNIINHNAKPDGNKYYHLDANGILNHNVKPNGNKYYSLGVNKNVGKDFLNHDSVKPNGNNDNKNVGKDLLNQDSVKPNGNKYYGLDDNKDVGKDLLNHDSVKPNGNKYYGLDDNKDVGKDLLNHDSVKPNGNKYYGLDDNKNVGKDLLNQDSVKPNGNKYYGLDDNKDVGKDLLNHNVKPNGNKYYSLGANENVGKDLLKHNVKSNGNKYYDLDASKDVGKDLLKRNIKPNGNKYYAHGASESVVEDSLNHNVKPNGNKYYDLDASENLKPDSGVASYFLEKDLLKEKKMKLHFTSPINGAKFLPREIANSIPFSSNKLLDILNRFGIKPRSDEAKIVQQTISECERATGIEGENIYCATSLESLIDFSRSKLGEKMKIYSTMIDKETKQVYNIKKGSIQKVGDKSVVCHKENYLYAVYYCHQIQDTRMYMASLEGVDGSKVNAIAACHVDTKSWNPKHLAFQLLNVKPGTGPICHFLSSDVLALVPN